VEYLFLYHFHFSPKFSYKNITYNLTLKYIFHFSYFVGSIILVQIYHHIQNIHVILNIFEELSTSSYKKFQEFQSSQYFHQIWCTHLVKILKCRKLYFVKTILGDFNVFWPNPHILFFGSIMVISSSNCKYWV